MEACFRSHNRMVLRSRGRPEDETQNSYMFTSTELAYNDKFH